MSPRIPAWVASFASGAVVRPVIFAGMQWFVDRWSWAGTGGPGTRSVLRAREAPYQILLYHRVTDGGPPRFGATPADTFRAQMQILARHFRVRPLAEVVRETAEGRTSARAICVTFDDGYKDNGEVAWPILRSLGLPATIFLATGPIDTGEPLWHDRLYDLLHDPGRSMIEWRNVRHSLADTPSRARAFVSISEALKRLQDAELRRELEAMTTGSKPPAYDGRRSMLTWDEVRRLAAEGVDFGAHTVTHPVLTRVPVDHAEEEIKDSKRAIESALQISVEHFAYPNGGRTDFDAEIQSLVRRAGFKAALTTLPGVNDRLTDPFALRRQTPADRDPHRFALKLLWYRWLGCDGERVA